MMGLLPGDQINGLALFTTDQGPTAHAGDVALFTLSPFSPDTFTTSGLSYAPGVQQQLSPGDILMTRFDGSFTLFAAAGDLGLLPSDQVTAVTTLAVPEPGVLMLAGVWGGAALVARARARLRRR
jgi:hypothetical protein